MIALPIMLQLAEAKDYGQLKMTDLESLSIYK